MAGRVSAGRVDMIVVGTAGDAAHWEDMDPTVSAEIAAASIAAGREHMEGRPPCGEYGKEWMA